MKPRRFLFGALMAFGVVSPAHDAEAEFVCADCHGVTGFSADEKFPHLAGQNELYLATQLEAFRSGKRKSQVMNLIARQLSDADIANWAAFFARQSCAANRPKK
jgi:cytochrome c553